MNYTKGEWKAISVPFENGALYVVYDGKTIASIKQHFGREQALANANLMAVAPEMYEELSLAIRTINDTLRHGLTQGQIEVLEICVRDGAKILAKAGGK